MRKIVLLIFILFLVIPARTQILRIAAAANLRYVLDEIKDRYTEKNPDVKIEITYGSSGVLVQQIINGAEFQLFMAADKSYPDKLKEMGYTAGEVKTYAYGNLVIWSNTVDVSKGPEILTDRSVNKIAVARPETAPYGQRAVECLKYYNLYDLIKGKIVYADNISQAAQFVETGNAEAGFLALSLAIAPEMKGKWYAIDPKSYQPIEQAMVLVKNREYYQEGKRFMDYLLSPECKPVFEKYGYKVP